MPTYSYRCDHCQHTFDIFQTMHDEPVKTCPQCNQNTVRRLIHGGAGIIFKGSGFYCTDYRKTSTPEPAKASS